VQETPGLRVREWVSALQELPDLARETLQQEPQIQRLAERFTQTPLCFFLGRGADAYVAYEGALKLKEVAYIPTEESPAGEMKHGPLALVEPGVMSVFGVTELDVLDKVLSNMREIQARSGTVVAISSDRTGAVEQVADVTVPIPKSAFGFLSALLSALPMQLLSYYVGNLRGCSIDQPRNLAKSVTVE